MTVKINVNDYDLIRKEQEAIANNKSKPQYNYVTRERLYGCDGAYESPVLSMFDPPVHTLEAYGYINVVGTQYKKNALNGLIRALKAAGTLRENYYYKLPNNEIVDCSDEGDRVWQYTPTDLLCRLVPEQSNEQDHSAIAVLVSSPLRLKWFNIGYIPKEKTKIAKQMIQNETVYIAELYGGKYKKIVETADYSLTVRVVREHGVCFKVKWNFADSEE